MAETFGCGQFLPGFGPGNLLPDDSGDNDEPGGPPPPPPPPYDIEVPEPPEEGDPKCKCRVVSEGESMPCDEGDPKGVPHFPGGPGPPVPGEPHNWQYCRKYVFHQNCKEITDGPGGDPPHSDGWNNFDPEAWAESEVGDAEHYEHSTVALNATAGGDCADEDGECCEEELQSDDCCPPLIFYVFWSIPGPITPGPGSPGTPGPAGPAYPGPQTPGPSAPGTPGPAGTPSKCRCVVTGGGPTTPGGTSPNGGYMIRRECKVQKEPGGGVDNDGALEKARDAARRHGLDPDDVGLGDSDVNSDCAELGSWPPKCCEEPPDAGAFDPPICCPDIIIRWGASDMFIGPTPPPPGGIPYGEIDNLPPGPGPGGYYKEVPGPGPPPVPGTGGGYYKGVPGPPNGGGPGPGGGGGVVPHPGSPGPDPNPGVAFGVPSQEIVLMDPDIVITSQEPASYKLTTTNNLYLNVFRSRIHLSIKYLLDNNPYYKDWSTNPIYSITQPNLLSSLNPTFLQNLRRIKKVNGINISDTEIYSLVYNKLVRGTIDELDTNYLNNLAKKTKKYKIKNPPISSNFAKNEVTAMALIDHNIQPLNPEKALSLNKKIVKMYKPYATDINMYLDIVVDGVLQKHYVNDDYTFVERNGLSINDGRYYSVYRGGTEYKIPAHSEIDHAYYADESVRSNALNILGEKTSRKLVASVDASSNVEYEYSLSSARQPFYFFSAIGSSIGTEALFATRSALVKKTAVQYTMIDGSSVEGVAAINKQFRYVKNHKVLSIDHADPLIDYFESTSSLVLENLDIIYDAPKTNKTIPILVRQPIWYLLIYPTNRPEYLTFGIQSKITSYDPTGSVVRSLDFIPALNPALSKSKFPQFIDYKLSWPDLPDVDGAFDTQTRVINFNPDITRLKEGMRTTSGAQTFGSPTTINPIRKKTGLRLLYDIVKELTTNYFLDTEGIGKGVNTFDVFSRLGLMEFNKFTGLENSSYLMPLIRKGLFFNTSLYPPLKRVGAHTFKKTRLLQRKANVSPDRFLPIKTLNIQKLYLIPPTTVPNSSKFGGLGLEDISESIPGSRE